MAQHHDPFHTHEHPGPSVYLMTAGLLTCLMLLTVWVYVTDFGLVLSRGNEALASIYNTILWMAIASAKAYFIVRNFMGVKWASKLVKLWALMGFATLPIMLMSFGDMATRHWEEGNSWTDGRPHSPYRSEVDPNVKALDVKYGHKAGHEGGNESAEPAQTHE